MVLTFKEALVQCLANGESVDILVDKEGYLDAVTVAEAASSCLLRNSISLPTSPTTIKGI